MNQQQHHKLKFRIISCSGEDPEHPASELLAQSPQSKGWQSPRFCEYPQEMVLQFMSPSIVKQIQFLSHQSKISTKIDIFVYMPDQNVLQYQSEDFKYKKLGFLSLDSNERSAFQARELKSVYLDNPCLYMKLIFQKCHLNKYNLFNQVGVIALSVFGQPIVKNQAQIPQPKGFEQLEYETQFDPTTLDRLRVLESAKQKAIKFEDFEEAKRLKEAMERLKQIGTQLQYLEERKNIAIQNEDYDAAQIIKSEIDKLRNAIAPNQLLGKYADYGQNSDGMLPNIQQSSNRNFNMNNNMAPQFPGQMMQQDMNQVNQFAKGPTAAQQYNYTDKPLDVQQEGNQDQQAFAAKKQEFMAQMRQEQQQQQQDFDQPNQQQDQYKKSQPIKKNENAPSGFQDHDEQVIPTHKGNKNDNPFNQPEEYPTEQSESTVQEKKKKVVQKKQKVVQKQEEESPKKQEQLDGGGDDGGGEQLSLEDQKVAEPLFPILSEDCVKKIFSSNWQRREEGLNWLEGQLQKPTKINTSDSADLQSAVFAVVNHTIGDKISSVVQKSLSVLISLLNNKTYNSGKISVGKGDIQSYIDNILSNILEKIGENNPRNRELGEQAMFAMSKNPSVTVSLCVHYLVKSSAKGKLGSVKGLSSRLSIMQEIVKKFKIDNANVDLKSVVDFDLNMLTHANTEVRNQAVQLLVEIYKIIGGKLKPLLANVKKAQMQILEQEFAKAAGGGGNAQPEEEEEEMNVIVETNIGKGSKTTTISNKKGTKKATKKPEDKPQQQQQNNEEMLQDEQGGGGDGGPSKTCEFCGKFDKNFMESGRFDIHLWKECPMLTTCKNCGQVVEISEYNEHLLKECKDKGRYRKCPRCKEAIEVSEYQDHTEEMTCLPFKPLNVANRCPLCHTDIQPRQQGWKKHLITEGCPNHERTINN